MSFGSLFVSLLFSTALFGGALSRCTPSTHRIITQSANPFEGGAVESCEIPTVTATCSGIVNYPVPTSIARLAAIIEHHIRDTVGSESSNPACEDTYREVLCSQKFPRCEENGSIVFNSYSCSDRVNELSSTGECTEVLLTNLQSVCNREQHTVPAGTCRPISEIKESDFTFHFCSILNQTTLVTQWMFEYIKYIDQEFSGTITTHPPCGQAFVSHMCNLIGRCTSDGEYIEFVNTQESCFNTAKW